MQTIYNLDAGTMQLQRLLEERWKVVFVINHNGGKTTYLILEKK